MSPTRTLLMSAAALVLVPVLCAAQNLPTPAKPMPVTPSRPTLVKPVLPAGGSLLRLQNNPHKCVQVGEKENDDGCRHLVAESIVFEVQKEPKAVPTVERGKGTVIGTVCTSKKWKASSSKLKLWHANAGKNKDDTPMATLDFTHIARNGRLEIRKAVDFECGTVLAEFPGYYVLEIELPGQPAGSTVDKSAKDNDCSLADNTVWFDRLQVCREIQAKHEAE